MEGPGQVDRTEGDHRDGDCPATGAQRDNQRVRERVAVATQQQDRHRKRRQQQRVVANPDVLPGRQPVLRRIVQCRVGRVHVVTDEADAPSALSSCLSHLFLGLARRPASCGGPLSVCLSVSNSLCPTLSLPAPLTRSLSPSLRLSLSLRLSPARARAPSASRVCSRARWRRCRWGRWRCRPWGGILG